jgi:hypothetical protein
MASAPDPMAELYNIFLDLKQKGQIPKEMGFEQFKQLMEEQSSSQGGIMDMVPREQALFGGRVNYGLGSKFKKAVKKVTGAVKDVVSSDLGKAALASCTIIMQVVVIYLDYKELDVDLEVLIIFQVYYKQEIFYKVFHLVMEIQDLVDF